MMSQPYARETRTSIALLLFFATTLAACNYPVREAVPEDTPERSTATATEALPSATRETPEIAFTDTPTPTLTPSPSASPDLSPPSMYSTSGDLICRFGPGLRYGVGGSLKEDVRVPVTARNGFGDWFQFELQGFPGKYCWLPATDVEVSGDLSQLAIAEAPLSFVTNVSVLLDPLVIEPTACVFPLTFNVTFTIETIGPTFVTFQRSQSNGLSAPAETVEFTEAGPMVFEDYLRADAPGEHWFRVSVSSPNSVVGQGTGTVVCP